MIYATIGALLLASIATAVFAAEYTLNWGKELNPKQCDVLGSPVINVVQKVINSVDSGEGGNWWAFSNYRRNIQVWHTSTAGEYCAIVKYEGAFYGESGQISPGAGYTLDGDEKGTWQGGYRATITGDLKTTPDWKTKGAIGTYDYDCNINGICLGSVNWVEQYFDPGYGFSYDWWGWIYNGGNYGTWVNSSDGNDGDIN